MGGGHCGERGCPSRPPLHLQEDRGRWTLAASAATRSKAGVTGSLEISREHACPREPCSHPTRVLRTRGGVPWGGGPSRGMWVGERQGTRLVAPTHSHCSCDLGELSELPPWREQTPTPHWWDWEMLAEASWGRGPVWKKSQGAMAPRVSWIRGPGVGGHLLLRCRGHTSWEVPARTEALSQASAASLPGTTSPRGNRHLSPTSQSGGTQTAGGRPSSLFRLHLPLGCPPPEKCRHPPPPQLHPPTGLLCLDPHGCLC